MPSPDSGVAILFRPQVKITTQQPLRNDWYRLDEQRTMVDMSLASET